MINFFYKQPKKLFLVDALGALVTFFMLFVVLKQLNYYFLFPLNVLNTLALSAACLCIYSFSCYFFVKQNWLVPTAIIAIANMLYCLATLGVLLFFYNTISIISIVYFIMEIAIISWLVYIEFKVAKKLWFVS